MTYVYTFVLPRRSFAVPTYGAYVGIICGIICGAYVGNNRWMVLLSHPRNKTVLIMRNIVGKKEKQLNTTLRFEFECCKI